MSGVFINDKAPVDYWPPGLKNLLHKYKISNGVILSLSFSFLCEKHNIIGNNIPVFLPRNPKLYESLVS